MIYLDNNTEKQEVWIERNDGLGHVHTGSSESYQEGFDDGYESGMTDQKNKLVTTAFTENGVYTREDGWSGVTVNVTSGSVMLEEKTVFISDDITNIYPSQGYVGMSAVTVDASEYAQSQYDDGFDDGFVDGFASGSSEEREKLSAVTFTANTAITLSDGGYSAVTVDVPQTGSSISLISITLTENTAITASQGSAYSAVTVNVDTASTYNSGYTDGQDSIITTFSSMTATTNGQYGSTAHPYTSVTVDVPQTGTSVTLEEKNISVTADTMSVSPSQGYDAMSMVNIDATDFGNSHYNSGHTDGVDEERAKLSAITFTANTAITLSDGGYSAVTVNVAQTGSSAVLGEGYFISNGTYSASTDSLDGYSAITIDVQDVSSALTICVTGGTWFVLDHIFNYGEIINIEHCTFDYRASSSGRHQQLISGGQGEYLRIAGGGDRLYANYGNSNGPSMYIVLSDNEIELTPTEFLVDGIKEADVNSSQHTWNTNMVVFANTNSGRDSVEYQTASVGTITISDSAGTVVAQYIPTLDENDTPCFYNPISDTNIYATNGNPMVCVVTGQSQQYQSGYTDGQNSIINTFTAMTATTNGVYGSSAAPLSSITVNVPTASTLPLSSITITANTAITETQFAYSAITVNVPQTVSGYSIDEIATGITCVNPVITQERVNSCAFFQGYLTGTLTFSGNNNPNLGFCEIEHYSFAAQGISNIVFDPNYDYVLYNGAFCQCMHLTALTIPNNVSLSYDTLSIMFEKGTFEMCQSLRVINVDSYRIAKRAFYNTTITAVTIGQNVEIIEELSLGASYLSIINSYATTAPNIHQYATSNELHDSWPTNGTVHYPAGSDYSSWQQLTCFSTWTFVGDL